MQRVAVFLLIGLALTGCDRAPKSRVAPPGVSNAAYEIAAPAADAAAPPDPSAPNIIAGQPMLAYAYRYGLSLPPARVDEMRRAHEAACVQAGYRLCQVVSTVMRELSPDEVSGELVLRADPTWLQRFRDGLATDARKAGGKVNMSAVTSEDLSREIVDTAAQLKAKITLRDRLQALLANRPGKLADLLDVERELARVQGEIDSTQSQLAVMQARVATSEITIVYDTRGAVPALRSPLIAAVGDFATIVAQSLAGLIRMAAWVAPWALFLGLPLWLLRKRLPRLRRRPGREPTPPPA